MIEFEEALNYVTNIDLCNTLKARVHTEMAMHPPKGEAVNEAFEHDCAALVKALDDYMEWESVYDCCRKR